MYRDLKISNKKISSLLCNKDDLDGIDAVDFTDLSTIEELKKLY